MLDVNDDKIGPMYTICSRGQKDSPILNDKNHCGRHIANEISEAWHLPTLQGGQICKRNMRVDGGFFDKYVPARDKPIRYQSLQRFKSDAFRGFGHINAWFAVRLWNVKIIYTAQLANAPLMCTLAIALLFQNMFSSFIRWASSWN